MTNTETLIRNGLLIFFSIYAGPQNGFVEDELKEMGIFIPVAG